MSCVAHSEVQAGPGITVIRGEVLLRVECCNDCSSVIIYTRARGGNSCDQVHPGVKVVTLEQFQTNPQICWFDRRSESGANILPCDCWQSKIGGLILNLQTFIEYGGKAQDLQQFSV